MTERIELNGSDWVMKEFVGLDWVWRDSVVPGTSDKRWWYPAKVPGTVLHDLFENGLVPDPYYEMNSKETEWVSQRTWVYKKTFFVPEGLKEKDIFLIFDGIDYSSEIFLNGISVGRQEGMYIPWEKHVGKYLKYGEENLVAVVIDPAPYEQPQVGRTSQVYTHKSRMTYWWDFCPRMIHQGIWQDVYLKVSEGGRMKSISLDTKLTADGNAEVWLEVETDAPDGWKIEGSFGEKKFNGVVCRGKYTEKIKIENPRLWWCNGLGEAYEYPAEMYLLSPEGHCSDMWKEYRGIREIKFEKNPGVSGDRKEQGSFLMNINGKRVFMNGYNWVPADVMYGAVSAEKMKHLIHLAKKAGVNILRVWGGGLIETDMFYRLCAKAGILVWQEFILSSSGIENTPSQKEEYCTFMEQQAREIIKRKRSHTALAIWCGGNELQDAQGRPLDGSHRLLHVLEKQVKLWDENKKWLPTSPSGGVFLNSMENLENSPEELFDVHGPWEHQGLESHYNLYNKGTCLLHSEFGVEGMTNYTALRNVLAPEHFLPANKDNPYYFHRGAWWTNEELVQKSFGGELNHIEQIRKASQYMQYEGLKYGVETNRRRAYHCSGCFPWQFNEPYPNLYCTSSVDYYGHPKPAYYGIKKVYSNYMVQASFESASLYGKHTLDAEIYAAADKREEELQVTGYYIEAEIFQTDGTCLWKKSWFADKLCAEAQKVGDISMDLECGDGNLLLLRLHLYHKESQERLGSNEYLFTKAQNFADVFELEEPSCLTQVKENTVMIENTGKQSILFAFLDEEGELSACWKENYLCILPGETKEVTAEGKLSNVSLQALNLGYKKIYENNLLGGKTE